MSSALRAFKQTPSNFFWSHGANLYSLDYIKDVFRGAVGSYSGPAPEYNGSFILFDTEAHFANATYELLYNVSSTYYAPSYFAHPDMGKRLYIGVKDDESRMAILGLVKINGTTNKGYGLIGLNLNEYTINEWDGDIDVDLIRGAA